MYTLFNSIALVVLAAIGKAMDTMIPCFLYTLAIALPTVNVTVRRLHDTGRSGFLLLVGLLPLIGGPALLVFTCIQGDNGPNRYGPDPKPADTPLPQY
jgi:uncharacterized membrane protein YhaH (DUF805 family)